MKMKMTGFPNLMVFGLTFTLAVAGCHKRPGAITPLPNRPAGLVGGEGPGELAGRLKPGEEVQLVDTQTGRRSFDVLEDERDFDAREVERKVTAPGGDLDLLELV